jgi:hypothetical protein
VRFVKHYPSNAEGGLSQLLDAVGTQAVWIICGLLLIVATDWFVDMAYPANSPDKERGTIYWRWGCTLKEWTAKGH